MAAMSVYERLGMRRVINADATLTRLGGSLMPAHVLDAMREAAYSTPWSHAVLHSRYRVLTG